MADINLETLYAINKLTYFVYKLHEDNERLSLIIATSGLQLAAQDSKDESEYIKPIGMMIEKKCWDITDKSSEENKQLCANPATAALASQK